MLSLNDPRWSTLQSNYTNGAQVARLLVKLEMDKLEEEEKERLWQELCHQYTASQAGYAAIPHLVRIAGESASQRALELLGQAAHILACLHLPGSDPVPEFLTDGVELAYQQGIEVVGAILAAADPAQEEVHYLLASLASLLKFPDLYFLLEGADMPYECPNCQEELVPLEIVRSFWQLKR
jgi:hypothetical protein